jgi:hypothetical protein
MSDNTKQSECREIQFIECLESQYCWDKVDLTPRPRNPREGRGNWTPLSAKKFIPSPTPDALVPMPDAGVLGDRF